MESPTGARVSDRDRKTELADELAALDAALGDDEASRFSVGQVAELLDMRPWFLRRLDSLGAICPSRSDGDQRRYSRHDIERLIGARALMREGVSVAGVRHVLELQDRVAELEAELAEERRSPASTAGRDRSRRKGEGMR